MTAHPDRSLDLPKKGWTEQLSEDELWVKWEQELFEAYPFITDVRQLWRMGISTPICKPEDF